MPSSRPPSEAVKLVDPGSFRAAMRSFASSVTIVTTATGGRPHGMTATAVASVSADPPTILVVINRTARTHPLIGSAGAFTVNVLSRDQQELATRFSSKHPDQFDGLDYLASPNTATPIFPGTASFIECELTRQVDVETHTVFFGRVLHCETDERVEPLLYYQGDYHDLAKSSAPLLQAEARRSRPESEGAGLRGKVAQQGRQSR